MGRKLPVIGSFSYLCKGFITERRLTMEKEEEKVQEQPKKSKMEELDEEAKKQGKKVNKTWEAFGKSKGCFIINDPRFLL